MAWGNPSAEKKRGYSGIYVCHDVLFVPPGSAAWYLANCCLSDGIGSGMFLDHFLLYVTYLSNPYGADILPLVPTSTESEGHGFLLRVLSLNSTSLLQTFYTPILEYFVKIN